jgi:hypothetical protein
MCRGRSIGQINFLVDGKERTFVQRRISVDDGCLDEIMSDDGLGYERPSVRTIPQWMLRLLQWYLAVQGCTWTKVE